MKTFVIAMDNEAETVIAHLADKKEELRYGRRVVRGLLRGTPALVIVSGIGKVNAGAATQLAFELSGEKEILNLGVVGGLEPGMEVGDLYGVKSAVQYDFDLTQLNGTEMGTLNERKTPYIPCAAPAGLRETILGSGDRFNDSEADYALLRRLGCGLRDMEGAAIAQVCERAGAKLTMYKCISDVHGSGATTEQYLANLKKCLAILSDYVETKL